MQQAELFGLIWWQKEYLFRLRANDVIRVNGWLGRVIRVTDCSAVVLMNRTIQDFTTRFDKHVRFTPPPVTFRISQFRGGDTQPQTRQRKEKT